MIDVSTILISELNKTGLKVYDENFVDSKTEVPCITYRPYDNSSYKEGDTLGYSNHVFHVKVWAKTMQDIVKYSIAVDAIMRELGFTRVTSNDLYAGGIRQRDMKYKALALENF